MTKTAWVYRAMEPTKLDVMGPKRIEKHEEKKT